jgi:thymidine kinase
MTENLIGEAHRPGRIEVVCGSMFSGKTEELIRRMKRAKFAKQKVEIFKPALDTRYSEEDVVSHDQNSIRSTPIESSGSILLLASDIDVVGIDEAQFLDNGLVEVCNELANRGVRVIVAQRAGIGPKGTPLKSISSPATITLTPRLASSFKPPRAHCPGTGLHR